MGRWAQRRIAGGGAAAGVNVMIAATADDDSLIITFAADFTMPTDWDNAFTAEPDDEVSISVTQTAPNQVTATFPTTLTTPGTVQYSTSDLGFQIGQIIAYT